MLGHRVPLSLAGLLLLASCNTGSSGSSHASGGPSAGAAAAADVHVPTVFPITAKSNRAVIRFDIGDAFEIPDNDANYDYRPEISDPTLCRSDSATHFTAIKSGPSRLLVWGEPVCHEADALACGRSKLRWSVQLIVR
jgi:hypothetical protein